MKRACNDQFCTQRNENPVVEQNSTTDASSVRPLKNNYFRMKRNPPLLFVAALLMAVSSFATVHMVDVADFSFSPSSFTMHQGDTILWMWVSGTHTTTSTNVPSGANQWNSNINSTTSFFIYVPSRPGNYSYNCSIHPSQMTGSFTVVSAAATPSSYPAAAFNLYPNPSPGPLHIQFSQPGLPASVTLTTFDGKSIFRNDYNGLAETEIDLNDIPNGIYMISVEQNLFTNRKELVINH
jgi:plastocyanin